MAKLMTEGRLVVCPAAMNHEALELLHDAATAPRGAYWRELEARLAAACDELVVLTAPGWTESRGVTREIALFQGAAKPVRYWHDAASNAVEDGRPTPTADEPSTARKRPR